MSVPTNKELMERFAKIQAAESKTLRESPEDNEGFQAGKPAGVLSKDDHSKPVTSKKGPGVKEAPKEYDAKDKKIDTDGGNKRDPGADKAQDKFEGSDSQPAIPPRISVRKTQLVRLQPQKALTRNSLSSVIVSVLRWDCRLMTSLTRAMTERYTNTLSV